MDLQLQSFDGAKAGNITVSEAMFDREYNESMVHQVVTAYLETVMFPALATSNDCN